MIQKTSLNTVLLVAILFLQLTKEPPKIETSPIQVTPAIAEPFVATAEPVADKKGTSAETLAAETVTVETRTIVITRNFIMPLNDPAAYYKAKESHLRAALMKKQ